MYSEQTEKKILSSMLLNEAVCLEAQTKISSNWFHLDKHKEIYKLLNDTRDPVVIAEKCVFKDVDPFLYINDLIDSYAAIIDIDGLIDTLKDNYHKREIVKIANDAIIACKSDSKVLIDDFQNKILNITETSNNKTFSFKDVARKTINNLHKKPETINTGINGLDNDLGIFCKGDITVIAGRPAMGKTAFCLSIATNAALSGEKVAIFSIEMSDTQLFERCLSAKSNVAGLRMRNRTLSNADWMNLNNHLSDVADLPIWVNDNSTQTVSKIYSECMILKKQNGLDMVIVDYLQLMDGVGENRTDEIDKISRGLVKIAKSLNVCMVPLAQLNRECEKRPDKRPMLSDLKSSGAIEQDADSVLMLYRDVVYNSDTEDRNICELLVRKFRHGPVGIVKCIFKEDTASYYNITKEPQPLAGDFYG